MTLDWSKHAVNCAQCDADLMRRLYRPKDLARIERFFCDRSCKGAWQVKNLRPISVEELRRLYIDEKLSANDIAKIVGRNSKRVWEWLALDGVETRPRGHDVRQHIKPGDQLALGRKLSDDHKQRLREERVVDGSKGLFRNGVHVLKGRKGVLHPRFKGGLTPERKRFYSSDEWKAACVEVWRRANARCERCGLDHRMIDRSVMKFHVHHVISFQVRATRADPNNLRLLCAPCHRFVHSRQNTARELLRELAA